MNNIHSTRSPSRLILLAGGAATAVALALALGFGADPGVRAFERTAREHSLVARVVERHVTTTLEQIDTMLEELAAIPKIAELETRLAGSVARAPQLRSVSVVDAAGRVLASSQPSNVGRQIDWSAGFRATPGASGFVLGRALFGRDLSESALTRVQPSNRTTHFIVAAREGAAGRIVAAIHPGALTRVADSNRQPLAERVSVVSTDAELLAGGNGVDVEALETRRYLPAIDGDGGVYRGTGVTDAEAIGAFRRSTRYPVVVIAEQPAREVEALAARESRSNTLGAGIAALLLALVTLFAWRAAAALERGRAEHDSVVRSLRESEQRRRAIQESAPDAIVTFDGEHRIVEFNQAAEQQFGWSRLEAVGQNLFERIIPEEIRPAFVESMRRFQTTGQALHMDGRLELTLRCADGQSMPAEAVLGRIDTATSTHYTLHVRDLRRQKEASAALRSSEQRHRIVLDSVREVIFQTDRDGAFTYLNHAWRRLVRVQVEEAIGRKAWEFVAERDRLLLQRSFEALLTMGPDSTPPDPVEVSLITSDGGIRLVNISLQPLRAADGSVQGATGTLDDITEKRAVEIKLREQLRLSQELLEAIPLPVALKDSTGVFQAVNRAWEQFTGHAREDVLDKTIFELFPRDIAERFAADGTGVIDGMLRRADGSMRNVLNYNTAFTRDDGSASGTISALVDITEQKASEEEARRAEQEARRAGEAAEAANRMKNEFLASISHELRTPLTGIIGMAGLALDGPLAAEPRENIELVRSSADTLLYIIDDMLDFARIESGELAIEKTTFNPRALVGEVMRMMAMRAHDKGLELVIDLDSQVPAALQGDANRLRQILVNLVNNAIKYTEQGEVELRVGVGAQDERTVTLDFAVRDTGPGIETERRKALLAAISGSGDAADAHKQTGALGLAITMRLVRLMGGSGLALDTAEGDGTTFRFSVPLATHPAGMVDLPSGSVAGRLLIVDANARARAGVTKLLARLGVNATSAALKMHVEMWLDAAMREGEPFDWALIDAASDEGCEIAREIAARSPDTRIVFMLTVAGRGSNPQPVREAGFHQFVRKPVLEHDVARVLSSAGAGAGEAKRPEATQAEARHAGAKILVAEDNMVNQALVRRLLQSAGYTVQIVANGRKAVEAVELERFDLILMDVQMPEMDGIEATRRIRELEANSLTRTPIVALTAHAFGRDRELCLAAGMDGHLAKPVKPASLHEVLAAHIGAATPAVEG